MPFKVYLGLEFSIYTGTGISEDCMMLIFTIDNIVDKFKSKKTYLRPYFNLLICEYVHCFMLPLPSVILKKNFSKRKMLMKEAKIKIEVVVILDFVCSGLCISTQK